MSEDFTVIENTWFMLRENFDDLNQQAPDDIARRRLLADRDGARDAYYLAMGKAFDSQDAFVKNTRAALKAVQADLKKALDEMKDVVATLSLVTKAVQLLAALAAMAV